MRLSWLFVSGPSSGPHNRCEKSESLSVSWERWVISRAQPWLLSHVPDSEHFQCCTLPNPLPDACQFDTDSHTGIVSATDHESGCLTNFLLKQDQLSSRRSAGRTFIGFITTQGTVQRQHVRNPFLPCCYFVAYVISLIWRGEGGASQSIYCDSGIAGLKKTRLMLGKRRKNKKTLVTIFLHQSNYGWLIAVKPTMAMSTKARLWRLLGFAEF